jgi:hypothetical protein
LSSMEEEEAFIGLRELVIVKFQLLQLSAME